MRSQSGWRLIRGGETMAILRPDGRALVPELDGGLAVEAAYETTLAFESVRSLFEREVELLDIDSEPENTEWADIWYELQAPGLVVESWDGKRRFAILWIHFKDGRAWWLPLYGNAKTAGE